MNTSDNALKPVNVTAAWLKARIKGRKPSIAIISGSGLADALPRLEDRLVIPYAKIPGFPRTTVKGHKGELVFGRLGSKEVVMMSGRFHYYEGRPLNFIAFPIRVLGVLGVRNLILTAAVGSLKSSLRPGDLLLLKDHINLMGSNPLMGNYNPSFGEMFPDMNEPYDTLLRGAALVAAKKLRMPVKTGVYAAVTGPSYETPAEVRVYRMLGGDVAGMSVVPETITARQLKMRVLGLCWISNFASGISKTNLSHDDVLKLGAAVSTKIKALLESLLRSKAV
ncbi:MAG TPA: purine-nucleoside phosphorylase [Elusimicrobia bacterium]|nr:purine-nucleoside phosphorylase [Elusimicrobiota bacterium]